MHSSHILEVGLKRNSNEDALYFDVINNTGIFVIADGMGGHLGGKEASFMATEVFKEIWSQHRVAISEQKYSSDYILKLLKYGFDLANYQILTANKEKGSKMGTTLSVVVIAEDTAFVMHIGDSRVYLVKGHHVQQITEDDTQSNEELKNGFISKAYYEAHSNDNRLTKCVGIKSNISPQFYQIHVNALEQFFLCSDGIYQYFSKEQLEEILARRRILDGEEKLMHIKDRVIAQGASDNYCGILVEI